MGSSAKTDYCAFTKAVEHLGDRWSLLIVRELVQFGPQGFSSLASGLPGHISRSVLAAKLRKLEELGLIGRDPISSRQAPYRLAPAGEKLVPTVMSLYHWAEQWVPEDPAMAQRDPSVIMWWLAQRVDPGGVPERQAVLELAVHDTDAQTAWLLVVRGAEATLCQEDPMLAADRYVYVEAGSDDLYPIARGVREWAEAIADGSVQVYGEPALVRAMPGWFVTAAHRGMREAGVSMAGSR
ncbi:MAG: helix-turn-helix domain-containing protein [Chloroflexota bacterium]